MTRKNQNKKKQTNNNGPNRNRNRGGNRQQRMVALSRPAPEPTLGTVGGHLGTIAGNFLSKIFGLGAYKLSQNTVFDRMANNQVPAMHSNSESVVFHHREYIADVSSSILFSSTEYSVNPGLSSSFPYLSALAQNFQEYEFRGLVYEFKSTSADSLNSTNTALGTVAMAAQYRADATAFVNKQQLLTVMWAVDGKPSESFILPVECSPKENPFKVQYIRGGPLVANQDVKMFDLAKITVATVGSQASSVVGELWASYEVALYKPQLNESLDLYGLSALYTMTAPVTAAPLGTARASRGDYIGLTLTNTTITFPRGAVGNFMVLIAYGGAAVTASFSQPTLTNCSFMTTQAANYFGSTGTSSTFADMYTFVYIPDPTLIAVITLPTSWVIPTAQSYNILSVCQINGSQASF